MSTVPSQPPPQPENVSGTPRGQPPPPTSQNFLGRSVTPPSSGASTVSAIYAQVRQGSHALGISQAPSRPNPQPSAVIEEGNTLLSSSTPLTPSEVLTYAEKAGRVYSRATFEQKNSLKNRCVQLLA